MKDKIGIFSFFAGAGFLDLGFEMNQNFQTLFVNEIHQPFMEIYQHARKQMKIEKPEFGYSVNDITSFLQESNLNELKKKLQQSKENYRYIGFIGGPPCPDFSIAGKNKGETGENGKLSNTYTELICKLTPDFFLFENVKGLYRTKKHRKFFEELKTKFRKAGYAYTERLINALDYGAPQDRERIILIGFHQCMIDSLHMIANNGVLQDFNWNKFQKYNTESVKKLPWPETHPFVENGITKAPKNIPIELTVQHWFNQNDVRHHPNKDQYFKPKGGLSRFQTIPEGDEKKKSYKRLHRWRYSPTAAYGNNEVHLHPYLARRLSVAEALAIQSLPKDFVLPTKDITLSNAFKAIGNGVPFVAAEALANNIYDYIKLHSSITDNSNNNG